jgi:HAD superfamily hydrolase (TIGR01450 family)
MGGRIAARLLVAGNEVVVWNRSRAKVAPLAQTGAIAVATPAEAAARAETLITMVSDPSALRAVSEGRDGIASGAHSALTVIEMSTVGPAEVARLAAVLPAGTGLLDAPVLGSVAEAEAGSLTIVVGGPAGLFERAMPVLSVLGAPIRIGELGAGAAAKLIANAAHFGTLATLGETIALARALGLSEDATHDVLAATPLAYQAERRRRAIGRGDYPRRFALTLARKDADLIGEAAAAAGLELRAVDAGRVWLAEAEAAGRGESDYTAMLAEILARSTTGIRGQSETIAVPVQPCTSYDGLIIDLDGVVWLGDQPIDGAAGAVARLRACGIRVLFVTNDPVSSRAEQAARLAMIGIPATAADVITSAAATARFLAGHDDFHARSTLVAGSSALRDEIEQAGFPIIPLSEPRRAELVIVGGHPAFDYRELRAATTAVASGARLFATGRDATVPTRDGPAPATGAILAAIETATGVSATVIGKPEPFVFEIARAALAGCAHIAVVGDNLASDIAGAKRSGLVAILVLTGTATKTDLQRAAIPPDLVVASLAELPDLVRTPLTTSDPNDPPRNGILFHEAVSEGG